MEDELLIELNRASFKEIFNRSISDKDLKVISYKQFFKLCCTLKIYPDLISSFDLKRILASIYKKRISEERNTEISYIQFEKLMLLIADHCFPSGDSLKLLISHIKIMCQVIFNVTLLVSTQKITAKETPYKIKTNFKLISTTRAKNPSNTNRKSLNKSNSQKLSLSGHITPKSNTVMIKKLFDFRSPSLKMITVRNRNPQSKIQKIKDLFEKFKKNNAELIKPKSKNLSKIRVIEKYVDNKCRNVIII